MTIDFTVRIYSELLEALEQQGYTFQTFAGYLENPAGKVVMLRHDIDDRKEHALLFARIQAEKKIRGSYYFRMVPQSFDAALIREIASMGHEIGYHYETMDDARGDTGKAYTLFCNHLETLRAIAPVQTICMHGSPRSPYDNRALWNSYSYRELGITGEPYFDLDFNKVGYLTDTGRRWNGDQVSVRDKVESRFHFNLRSTRQLIDNIPVLPEHLMLTFHPQRWTSDPLLWTREYLFQNLKNQVKKILIRFGNR